jgi:hypothetical protein
MLLCGTFGLVAHPVSRLARRLTLPKRLSRPGHLAARVIASLCTVDERTRVRIAFEALEPSVHRLVFEADADPVLVRLESELSKQGEPPITMRRLLVFESDTGDFMLRARVSDALMNVCGHDAWARLFRPLD